MNNNNKPPPNLPPAPHLHHGQTSQPFLLFVLSSKLLPESADEKLEVFTKGPQDKNSTGKINRAVNYFKDTLCWGWNPGPHECWAIPVPLNHIQVPSLVFKTIEVGFSKICAKLRHTFVSCCLFVTVVLFFLLFFF
jgi:hypothetical protein